MEIPQDSKRILLSVIVTVVSDTTDYRLDLSHLEGCLQSLGRQVDPPTMEIIVPYPSQVSQYGRYKSAFPEVCFLPISDLTTYPPRGSSREHHDELRARGLVAAKGEIVALLEDHARPDVYWASRLVKAHHEPYAAIGGAIENGIDRLVNWAVYYCDFYRYQNPVPAGDSAFASDANISYKRAALYAILPVWEKTFHEREVNKALLAMGEKITLSPTMIVYQYRKNLRLNNAINERFVWGRSYAASRCAHSGIPRRLIYAALSPVLPTVLTGRMVLSTIRKGSHMSSFIKAFPLTVLLTVSWSLGELSGYLSARPGIS